MKNQCQPSCWSSVFCEGVPAVDEHGNMMVPGCHGDEADYDDDDEDRECLFLMPVVKIKSIV